MRYWSLCNNENVSPFPVVVVTDPATGGAIYGCSADLDTPVVDGTRSVMGAYYPQITTCAAEIFASGGARASRAGDLRLTVASGNVPRLR